MSIDIISKIQTGTPPDTNATQLFLMDVEKFLDALPQQPLFDLVVTSPPYNIGKEYETQKPLTDYVAWQRRIIEKIYPRLKDNGSICWQVGNYVENGSITPLDIELAPIFKDLNLHLRNRIIWHFGHAGLLSDHLDAGIIDWWDTIATHIRMQTKQSKIGTGRLGERNTIKYERSRTNIDPMWMSIDSNLLGYDIKSQVSKNDPGTLLIEVKASTFTLSRAEFYVTSNEWNVAITSGAYVFHLWCLSDGKKMLAILSPDEILPYIPTNNLDGQYKNIPKIFGTIIMALYSFAMIIVLTEATSSFEISQ